MGSVASGEKHGLARDESERIDILRVWFTIMVVFIHANNEQINFAFGSVTFETPLWLEVIKYTVSEILSRCAVPGFFFLSAYLLYRKPYSYGNNLSKKFKTLLVPYFMLNTFWILVFWLGQRVHFLAPFFSRQENIIASWKARDWLAAYFGSPSDRHPMLYPLWFLRDLFVVNLLARPVEKAVAKLGRASAGVFILLWLVVEQSHLFFLDIKAVCFWSLGCCFARSKRSLSLFDRMDKLPLSLMYLCLIITACILRHSEALGARVLHRACILVGLVFWYVCSTKLGKKARKAVLFVSRYTFCIYLFHEFNLTILKKALARLLPSTPLFQTVEFFGMPVMIVAFCLLLSLFIEKYAHSLYAVISGGRRKRLAADIHSPSSQYYTH